jgi:hypothetical protein
MSNTQLPAHLLALFNANPELAQVGANVHNEAHAKIKFNGKKWRFMPASGDEITVKPIWVKDAAGQPVGDSPINAIDVIVIDINENKSHVVYENTYNPDEESAPVWSSDDGTPVPVEHQNKVVSDYRRVAVISADPNIVGVYELRVSAGSITNFDRYNTGLKNNGVPIAAVVTRITFDDTKDYPKLVFAAASYLDTKQASAVAEAVKNKAAIKFVIGQGGAAHRPALAAPAAPPAALPAPSGVTIETPAVEKKTRTKKVLIDESDVGPKLASIKPPTQASAVVTKPQAADSDLDALLSNIMGR